VKLGDFGLSTSVSNVESDSPSAPATEIGTVLGTPEWMAPEQVDPKRGPMDARTDVHALGLVLDRLLTGRCVYGSRSREAIYRRVLEVEPEPADSVVPGIHPDLVAVCRKCLAKRPGERYPSAAELAVDLSRFLDGRPTIARPLTPRGSRRRASATTRHSRSIAWEMSTGVIQRSAGRRHHAPGTHGRPHDRRASASSCRAAQSGSSTVTMSPSRSRSCRPATSG
jgi:serine/threonine protein kinase